MEIVLFYHAKRFVTADFKNLVYHATVKTFWIHHSATAVLCLSFEFIIFDFAQSDYTNVQLQQLSNNRFKPLKSIS